MRCLRDSNTDRANGMAMTLRRRATWAKTLVNRLTRSSILAFVVISVAACAPNDMPLAQRVDRGELEVAPFNAASIELVGSDILVQRTGSGAAGVHFFGEDGQAFGFAFSVEGGPVTLRLRRDGDYEWRSPERGYIRLDQHYDEALLYSETADSFSVRPLMVSDCERSSAWYCYTSDDLRAEIFPENEPEDTRELLLALLNWASHEIDMTDDSAMATELTQAVAQMDAPAAYARYFSTDSAGVQLLCRGA